ncbi:unnamed protein product [marine sediment metagenome]|uniref:Uncharacterized protein n=1 Tax=marine sediment metagenome TaxID=412755 RepID=X0X7I5_9ZZZZ
MVKDQTVRRWPDYVFLHALLDGSVFAWMVMDYGLEEEPRSFSGGPRYYAYYRRGEMKALLRRAGFRALALESYPERVLGEEIVRVWAQKP